VKSDTVYPALYAGFVTHARKAPLDHRFRYQAAYWLVDYDHLPQPAGWMGAMARIRAADHADIRTLLAERDIAATRILLLTTGRTAGYSFNPISLYWCYDDADRISAVLAEVHNTYGESHVYVLSGDTEGEVDKAMYVSPFYPIDGHYQIRVSPPGDTVSVAVTLVRAGDQPFVATMNATRRPITLINLVRYALRYPGIRTSALIRWQALKLWRRGLKVVPR
jgi:DUF1365 family protein